VVDLAGYVLVKSQMSRCADCDQYLFLLAPRSLERQAPPQPFYFLCLCGAIRESGQPGEIAPSERPSAATSPPQPSNAVEDLMLRLDASGAGAVRAVVRRQGRLPVEVVVRYLPDGSGP
jgi:hypothetical protein